MKRWVKWAGVLGRFAVLAMAFVLAGMLFSPAKILEAANGVLGNHWETYDGKSYWYEGGVRQGTFEDKQGVVGDGTVRGREICDPDILDEKGNGTWFWLDSAFDGAKACNKEVWMPYIYSNEKDFDDEAVVRNAAESGDMAAQVERAIRAAKDGVTDSAVIGKWVRYDKDGKMIKGWYTVEGDQAKIPEYESQIGNTYYYDFKTGLMAKGTVTIDGKTYQFDEVTGVLIDGEVPVKGKDDTGNNDTGAYAVNGKNGKIHIVGKCPATNPDSDSMMTEPVYFDTYEEAESFSKENFSKQDAPKCGNCWKK